MAKKVKASDPSQAEQNVGEILSKTDQFIDKYWKQILIGVAAIILVVVGIIVFRHAYLVPRENNAQIAIFPGENYFANQQWEIALNGDSLDYIGFIDIIDEYSGTETANLAKAYAGICQYNLGDYEAALNNLKSYSSKDDLFAAQIQGAIGDCQVNLGNIKQGIDFFKKAASKANNSTISPIYLNKAAIAYESLEEYKEALDIYTTIKTKYPQSQEAASIDKYIERAKALIK
ncbi:MAG: tetratricopeptide repeat protein [Bacteroidales bacterium]|nr:tetratricopeptide repeat protein [Bacteroidales bacterium]